MIHPAVFYVFAAIAIVASTIAVAVGMLRRRAARRRARASAPSPTAAALAAMYKRQFTPERVAAEANREHPLFAAMPKPTTWAATPPGSLVRLHGRIISSPLNKGADRADALALLGGGMSHDEYRQRCEARFRFEQEQMIESFDDEETRAALRRGFDKLNAARVKP